MEIDRKELLLSVVFTQLKNENFKHWSDDVLELDSDVLKYFIDMDETIVKEYINFLIDLTTTSKYSNNNIDFESFVSLCRNPILEGSILNCVEEIYYDEDCCNDYLRMDVMYNVFEILLYSIFEYVNEYYKLSDIEISSFLCFGKNLFYDIQTQS